MFGIPDGFFVLAIVFFAIPYTCNYLRIDKLIEEWQHGERYTE